MNKFIGEKEIALIEGKKVTFVDWTTQRFTKKQLGYMVTDEATNPTDLRNKLIETICPEIFKIIEEYDIKKSELHPIMETVFETYNRSVMIAIGKAFGTYDEDVHFNAYESNIRVSDIARLMKK